MSGEEEDCPACRYWATYARLFGWDARYAPLIAAHMRAEHEPACS